MQQFTIYLSVLCTMQGSDKGRMLYGVLSNSLLYISDLLSWNFFIKVEIINRLKILKNTLCIGTKKTTQQFHRRIDPNVMDCLFSSWNSAKKKSCIRFIVFYRLFWIRDIFLSLVPGNHVSNRPTIFCQMFEYKKRD